MWCHIVLVACIRSNCLSLGMMTVFHSTLNWLRWVVHVDSIPIPLILSSLIMTNARPHEHSLLLRGPLPILPRGHGQATIGGFAPILFFLLVGCISCCSVLMFVLFCSLLVLGFCLLDLLLLSGQEVLHVMCNEVGNGQFSSILLFCCRVLVTYGCLCWVFWHWVTAVGERSFWWNATSKELVQMGGILPW